MCHDSQCYMTVEFQEAFCSGLPAVKNNWMNRWRSHSLARPQSGALTAWISVNKSEKWLIKARMKQKFTQIFYF